MRVEVTMKHEGTKAGKQGLCSPHRPPCCRAGGWTLLILCPPLRLQDSQGGPRQRDSPAPVLCHTAEKAMDGIKLSLIKHLLSQQLSSASSDGSSAARSVRGTAMVTPSFLLQKPQARPSDASPARGTRGMEQGVAQTTSRFQPSLRKRKMAKSESQIYFFAWYLP